MYRHLQKCCLIVCAISRKFRNCRNYSYSVSKKRIIHSLPYAGREQPQEELQVPADDVLRDEEAQRVREAEVPREGEGVLRAEHEVTVVQRGEVLDLCFSNFEFTVKTDFF